MADYNNDGFIDLYTVTFGSTGPPNRLYRNNGDGTFLEVAQGRVRDHLPISLFILPDLALLGKLVEKGGSLLALPRLFLLSLELSLKH